MVDFTGIYGTVTDSSPYPNLALERLGAAVTGCSDEFFAAAGRIIGAGEPVFEEGRYDSHGKWMDGWETRRRRSAEPDHDWLELKLGSPALVKSVNVSTRHFNGNQPVSASLDCSLSSSGGGWAEAVDSLELAADADNWCRPESEGPWDSFRLRIHPDGGVARLRIHGLFVHALKDGEEADLASILNGARAVAWSDAHFGAAGNMLLPGDGLNMGDGWETARRRGPGHDWAVVELGCRGVPQRVTVDTSFFKGNYPDRCDIQAGCAAAGTAAEEIADASAGWEPLLAERKLGPDRAHEFEAGEGEPVTHLRLNIHPDGGISRLRVLGTARP